MPAQAQKKQQTISSFFGAKPAAAAAATAKAPAKSPLIPTRSNANIAPPAATASDQDSENSGDESRSKKTGSIKRSLEGCTYQDEPAKKARIGTKHPSRTSQGRDIHSPHSSEARQPSSPPRSPNHAPAHTAADRTTRYMFSSSAVQTEQDDDAEYALRKERLHQRFIKKLGHPDSISQIKRRNRFIEDATGADMSEAVADDEDGQAEADEEQDARGKKSSGASKAKPKSTKLTPMEKQIIEIKRQHMDAVIVVEVGYKFRFFGEDARIAAKELSIVCIPGKLRFDEHPSEAHMDRFASASIPTHRLHVHVRRLVAAGHKVGVVRQLETAALKAAGDNRNAPFARKLTNMYTKGTYIEDVEGLDAPTAGPSGGAPATGHLLCITERNAGGSGSDELVHVGILAVQPGTGDIVYDEFDDGFMRSEIETRLLHIAPCEFLIVGEMSKATDKLIQHLSGSKTNVFKDKARVERVDKTKRAAAESAENIGQFYRTLTQSAEAAGSDGFKAVLDTVRGLPEQVTICLSAMIKHLTEYGLEHVFDLTNNFQAFSARSHMLLNGNTLSSLEIYRNQTDNTEKGSLFWVMDRTQTRFGQRLLRKWVGRPLLDKARLQERVDAVEELKDGEKTASVDKLRNLLSKTKSDLEKSLIRIYYRKCTRPELLAVLQTMQRIATEYAHVKGPADAGFDSLFVNEAIAQLPLVLDDLLGYLERINPQAAKDNDKYEFFREEHQTDDIASHKLGISLVEEEFQKHRKDAAQKLRKTKVDYVTVAGIDYLIEVENTSIKNVPASWAKISGTKKVSRFHTPEVIRMIRERDQHKESLAAACDAAFDALLADISTKYQEFRNIIQSLATLDCLLSLADVASRPDYCKPTFCSDTRIEVKGGRHPMVEQLLLDAYVPNDISLANADDETRALIVTGPNMGGKSSYVRQVALTCIMGQIGSYVPAASASLGMLDAVFTRMGAFDNMMAGESTFMVELSETADILKQATPRSLVILDELGRGTSTHDGVAIAHAVLEHMVRSTRCLLLFITHYQNLSTVAAGFERGELRNVHMRFTEAEAGPGADDDDDDDDDAVAGDSHVTFLYELGDGVAHRSYGLNVARLAGLPRAVRDVAHRQSQALERATRAASLRSIGLRLGRMLGGAVGDDGDSLKNSDEDDKQKQDDLAELVGGISML